MADWVASHRASSIEWFEWFVNLITCPPKKLLKFLDQKILTFEHFRAIFRSIFSCLSWACASYAHNSYYARCFSVPIFRLRNQFLFFFLSFFWLSLYCCDNRLKGESNAIFFSDSSGLNTTSIDCYIHNMFLCILVWSSEWHPIFLILYSIYKWIRKQNIFSFLFSQQMLASKNTHFSSVVLFSLMADTDTDTVDVNVSTHVCVRLLIFLLAGARYFRLAIRCYEIPFCFFFVLVFACLPHFSLFIFYTIFSMYVFYLSRSTWSEFFWAHTFLAQILLFQLKPFVITRMKEGEKGRERWKMHARLLFHR